MAYKQAAVVWQYCQVLRSTEHPSFQKGSPGPSRATSSRQYYDWDAQEPFFHMLSPGAMCKDRERGRLRGSKPVCVIARDPHDGREGGKGVKAPTSLGKEHDSAHVLDLYLLRISTVVSGWRVTLKK